MDIIVTPVFVDEVKMGNVIEWINRSVEIQIENEIDDIIDKAAAGDFSQYSSRTPNYWEQHQWVSRYISLYIPKYTPTQPLFTT